MTTHRHPHKRLTEKVAAPQLSLTVGQRLKALRQQHGFSLRKLALLSGVSYPNISSIERDNSSPSVSILKRILEAMQVTMSDFFSDHTPATKAIFYKADELVELADGRILSYKQVGTNLDNHALMILYERYASHADTGVPYSHEGEEGGVVVKGRLEITVGDEVKVLTEGDAYYFNSKIPHRMRNPFDEECIVVSAASPPSF